MKYRRIFLILFLILTGCSSRQPSNSALDDIIPGNPVTLQKGCGDGICDGPETTSTCPEDCQTIQAAAPSSTSEIPPLYFFYTIHAHGSDEFLPYTGPAKNEINSEAAENMIAAIDGIAEVLDKYGVKGTWEFLPATVEGLQAYQGKDHIFGQLLANGHEIGVHTHKLEDIAPAVEALQSMGISPITTSGFLAQVSKVGAGDVQAAMSLAIQIPVEKGLTVGTANLSPGGDMNTISSACQNVLGVGNDMWQETGNLMFPWRPDYLHQDICTHNPQGELLIIDHVSIEWVILPEEGRAADVVDTRHFNQLKDKFEAAIMYMEEKQPDHPAAWGFVTHVIEYAVGGKAENPPLPESLAALDEFLSYVDIKHQEGQVIYATSGEIAEIVASQE